jgi:hypothetical protein
LRTELSSLGKAQIHHAAFAMTHGLPLRSLTAPVVVSFAIGYGMGMMLNATLLANPSQLSARDLSRLPVLR